MKENKILIAKLLKYNQIIIYKKNLQEKIKFNLDNYKQIIQGIK